MKNILDLDLSVVALISGGTPDSTVMTAFIMMMRRIMTNETEIKIWIK